MNTFKVYSSYLKQVENKVRRIAVSSPTWKRTKTNLKQATILRSFAYNKPIKKTSKTIEYYECFMADIRHIS